MSNNPVMNNLRRLQIENLTRELEDKNNQYALQTENNTIEQAKKDLLKKIKFIEKQIEILKDQKNYD